MNIFLYLNRWNILNLDTQTGGGKKFVWVENRVDNVINTVIPDVYDILSRNQAQASAFIKANGLEFFTK